MVIIYLHLLVIFQFLGIFIFQVVKLLLVRGLHSFYLLVMALFDSVKRTLIHLARPSVGSTVDVDKRVLDGLPCKTSISCVQDAVLWATEGIAADTTASRQLSLHL